MSTASGGYLPAVMNATAMPRFRREEWLYHYILKVIDAAVAYDGNLVQFFQTPFLFLVIDRNA
jgi:hypothetical protein